MTTAILSVLAARSLAAKAEAAAGPPATLRPAAVDAYPDFLDRFGPAYRAELEAFVATVRDGGPSLCPLTEARAALVVALAADRSRAERRPVTTEEVTSAQALAG